MTISRRHFTGLSLSAPLLCGLSPSFASPESFQVPQGLGLFPAQIAILKHFYGNELSRKVPEKKSDAIILRGPCEGLRFSFSEQEYIDYLWNEGKINHKETLPRSRLIWVIGRRAGASSFGAYAQALELQRWRQLNLRTLYKVPVGEPVTFQTTSCNANSRETFISYRDHILHTYKDIGLYPSKSPLTHIVDMTSVAPYYYATHVASLVCTDVAFYKEALPFGRWKGQQTFTKFVALSAPNGAKGQFFDLYKEGFSRQDTLVLRTPSWDVHSYYDFNCCSKSEQEEFRAEFI